MAVNYHTSQEAAHSLVEELTSIGDNRHIAVGGDVSTAAGVDSVIDTVFSQLGPIHILVNNAGPFSKTPYVDLEEWEWDQVWNTNVKAAYLCARAVAPGMRGSGWGRIVNLSAVSAVARNRSIYGLAKSSIETLTQQLALELAPEITVNAVAPGQIRESLDQMAGIDSAWAEEVPWRTPLKRLVTRSEVADLVALLCLPAFDMVTGATIPLDGGLRLHTA